MNFNDALRLANTPPTSSSVFAQVTVGASSVDILDSIQTDALVNTNVRAAKVFQYKSQTGNFTVGDTITGGTSGATGTLRAQQDDGATGTLVVSDVVGTYVIGEAISNGAAGDGVINSVPVDGKAIDYDGQVANFTVGDRITNLTRVGSGLLVAQNDGGATGTIGLKDVTGSFSDNDLLSNSGDLKTLTCKLVLMAHPSNTGIIYVGNSATASTSRDFPLAAGASVALVYDPNATTYQPSYTAIASAASQTLCCLIVVP